MKRVIPGPDTISVSDAMAKMTTGRAVIGVQRGVGLNLIFCVGEKVVELNGATTGREVSVQEVYQLAEMNPSFLFDSFQDAADHAKQKGLRI